jgi:glycosyltransferase involved in cell wall biosynthesis
LRILYVSAYLPTLGIAAGSTRMYRVIESAAARHDVSILSYYETDEELRQLSQLQSMCRSVETIRRGQSLQDWRRDPLHLVPRSILLEFGNRSMRTRIAEECSSEKYDLVQFEFINIAYLYAESRLPSVFVHHEVMHRAVARRLDRARTASQRLSLAVQWLRALHFELNVCSRFTSNVFMTENDANSIRRFLPHVRSFVNRTGVDLAYFRPQAAAPEFGSLVFMGYFRHTPNVDAVMYMCRDILPRIWRHDPTVTFTIVGGSPPPAVQALARDPRIRVLGWVEDYRPALRRATIFVAPIVSGAGIRGKVTEAWAMGMPVLATPLAVEGQDATDGQNVLIAADTDAFAQKALMLLSNASLQHQLGKAARAHVEAHFNWMTTLAEHEHIYRRTIAGFHQSA